MDFLSRSERRLFRQVIFAQPLSDRKTATRNPIFLGREQMADGVSESIPDPQKSQSEASLHESMSKFEAEAPKQRPKRYALCPSRLNRIRSFGINLHPLPRADD